MRTHRTAVLGLVLGISAFTACDAKKQEPAASGQTAATTARIDTPRALAPGDPRCPRDGLWRPCALVDRISRAGLGIRPMPDSTHTPLFSVAGVQYKVGRSATLAAFFYTDSGAVKRDVAKADTTGLRAPGDTVTHWSPTAVFIRSGNLVVVFDGEDAEQVERVRLAITAGAPFTAPANR